ncbi:MAG: oligosaccharide flippase family protein, partial [Gammaproteobacteria bacterium]|nr:oligosaccharide flippase family protein [Gammaproteobacteria bacterium]
MAINNIIKHLSIYMVGEVLIMSAGLISFPIFTRIFTKEEYGVMSLVLMSIVIAELLFNFGLRHATQRFSSFYEKQGQYTLFYSTVLWTSLVLGLLGTIFTFAMGQVLTSSEIISSSIGLAVSISSFLIIIRILTQVLGSLFRAKGRAKEYVIFAVFTKYLGMTLAVVFVLFFHMEVQGFFLGLVIGEAIVL